MHDPRAITGYSEASPRRVRVVFGGETIADSTTTRLVWEHGAYPEYYFPHQDVRTDLLMDSDHESHRDALGGAIHFTPQGGDTAAPDAAWQYPESSIPEIRDLIRFDWAAMDRWYEEDEEVFVHPRNPYARIDAIESRRHIEIEIDGVVVADSVRPRLLFETGMPTRYYLPQDDARLDLLTPTDKATRCPYKGSANYWTARVNDMDRTDIVWSYQAPLAEAAAAGLLCFYNEKVDITVDGHRQTRPVTTFS